MMASPAAETGTPGQYGDWERDKVLGKGAFGAVYLWVNPKTRKAIAIKKIIKQMVDNKSMSRWKTEVKLMKEMRHPNIVSFLEIPQQLIMEYPSHLSVGMEYCSGGDLRRFMVKAEFCCGLPEYHVRDVLLDIGSAIHYLHDQHNMHRDLKPENIVLKPKPDYPGRYQFKITDLGYAKDLDSQTNSGAESFVGTMLYLAPEQMYGRQLDSAKTTRYHSVVDYWSFGLVMFECITARRPFFHNDTMSPGYPLMLVRDKKDKHICAWLLPNDEKYFCDHIQPPHSLSPDFAKDMTLWLRLMLCVEGERRGGRDGKEWYNMITNVIAPKKYIRVLNISNMEILSIQIEENSLLHLVNMKIFERTKIQSHHQLLLFANGDIPNSKGAILDQLIKANPESPYNALIFLFDKSWSEYRLLEMKTPEEISQFASNRDMERSDKAERHIFRIAVNDTFNNVKTGIRFQNASMALLEALSRNFTRLKEKLQELTNKTYKLEGMRELFRESMNNDIREADEQDKSTGIPDVARYESECLRMLDNNQEWEETIKKAQILIKESTTETQHALYVSLTSYRQEILKTTADLDKRKEVSANLYDNFRRELKKMETTSQRESKKFQKEQIQNFVDKVWKAVRIGLHDMLAGQKKNVLWLKSFVKHYCTVQDALFRIENMLLELNCTMSNIREQQTKHQHDLWIMLQHLKRICDDANECESDEDTLPDFYDAHKSFEDAMNQISNDEDIARLLIVPTENSPEHHQRSTTTATTSNSAEPHDNSYATTQEISKKADCSNS